MNPYTAVLLACALTGPAIAQQRPNIILVSLDQLRADRLHVYGNPRPTSPNLDRMAAEGMRFSRFYSAASWTTPSYASMMTSQFPSRHGATLFHTENTEGLHGDAITLAELFRKAGYKTGAFVNNGNAGKFLTGNGFDDYDQGQRPAPNITERVKQVPTFTAPATNARVLQWLDQNRSKPFFLFLLYIEPHSPYDPPPQHDLFKNDAYPNETNTGYDLTKGKLFRWANLGDPKAIERLGQLYDGKIHFIDYYFGQVLERLRARGLNKNTIVLLTSDHGELLYTHRADYMTFDHRSLYDQVMHVPAIFWGRRVPAGKVSDALAGHIDIAPTLLELAGLPPKPDAQGSSLVPVLNGKKNAVREYLFGEQDVVEPLRSVRDARYKLILNTRTGRKQLFDHQTDPEEQTDVAERHPEIVSRLASELERWRKENEPEPGARDQRWRAFASKDYTIDEMAIGATLQLTGEGWKMGDEHQNFHGGCYWTEPAKAGETPRTAVWRPDNPLLGRYRISLWYGGLPDGKVATRAPFSIETRKGAQAFQVDQTQHTGAWRELAIVENPLFVKLTNQANGRIIVDAVRFERLD